MAKRYFFADIESHNAGKEYGMSPREFFRLGQYAWDDGPVHLTTDYDEFMRELRSADYVVFHNGISFDLSVLFGPDSIEPLQMALDNKIIDTFVIASLVTPPPYSYTDRKGHTYYDAAAPGNAMKYLSLDNLCYQFGIDGKLGNLQELAKKHNPPKTPVSNLDYGLIPLDDLEFLAYAKQDVIAVRALWRHLLQVMKQTQYPGEYIWRELLIWSINAQISRNGILVDTELAQSRVDELAGERDKIMKWLVDEFGMPTNTKQPWKSNGGKEAILSALESFGITPHDNPNWTLTASGAPSFSGETMLAVTSGTEAEKLGEALATLQGQRSLAQLALDSTHPDDRVHPSIMCLQRSGRTSVQRPGLTVWTARGEGAVEKSYFIADPGTYMVEMDFSAADARAVAAMSGDPEYAKRFEPGADPHEITGRIFFKDRYDTDPAYYRNRTKPGTHGMSYRVGKKKLAVVLDVSVDEAGEFLRNYAEMYPWVVRWQDEVTAEGEEFGYVTNAWGRRMTVDEGRSFTQSSALHGQSTTRELLFDGLIRIARDNIERIRWIRATVHDAIVVCVPCEDAETHVEWIRQRMESTFDPGTKVSQPIHFPVSVGPIGATNWFLAGH